LQKFRGTEASHTKAHMECEKKQPLPVFIENPDGSIFQGIPLGYKEPTPPSTPAHRLLDPSSPLQAEVVKVLAKHELLFLLLLVTELVVECAFEVLHMQGQEDAILELSLVYPSLSLPVLKVLYWLAFAGESVFAGAFFTLGVTAACRSQIRLYQRFATVALAGTLGQLPLAYLNRFNLLVFFLRFISYAYARFQWNLLYSINLVTSEFTI